MNQVSNAGSPAAPTPTSAPVSASTSNTAAEAVAAITPAAPVGSANLGSAHPVVLPASINEAALDALCSAIQATWVASDYGPTLSTLSGLPLTKDWIDSFFAPITELGVLTVKGADAKTFLQGQLTNDIASIAIGQTLLAGYCTAKGRLLATMQVVRDADDSYALLISRPLAVALRKRLAMYVMRSKCIVTDLSDQLLVIGLVGAPARARSLCAAANAIIFDAVDLPTVADLSAVTDAVASAKQRYLACVGVEHAPGLIADLKTGSADNGSANSGSVNSGSVNSGSVKSVPPRDAALWRWTDCRAGQPLIIAQTSELFVPQMINLELVNGVSFKKGCYPGQEVVARSHYLGKLKRRMFLGHSDWAPVPGSDVMAAGASEPVGQVVMAGPHPNGGFDCLFESQIEAARNAPLMVSDQVLTRIELPYAL